MKHAKQTLFTFLMAFAICLSMTVPVHAEDVVESTGIELNLSSLSLAEGKSNSLDPVVMPENATDKTFTTTSSDDNVATVDENGRVTAVGYGTCVITFTSGDKKSTATCKVNVKCTEFTLDDATLNFGNTMTLAPAFKKDYKGITNDKITWKSSDEKVATIDKNGVVTATGKGTVTITGTLEKENNFGAEEDVTASCEIIVKKLVEKIEIEKKSYITYGGKLVLVSVKAIPEDADNTALSYSVPGDNLVSLMPGGENQLMILTSSELSGTATITVKTTDGSNLEESITVVVLPSITEIKAEKEAYTIKEANSVNIPLTIKSNDKVDTDTDMLSYRFITEKDKIYLSVTGKKAGKADVTLTSFSNPDITAKVTVTVEAKEEVKEEVAKPAPTKLTFRGVTYVMNEETKTAKVAKASTSIKGKCDIAPSIEKDGVKYTVTEIADNAFKGAKKMTAVSIPTSVKSIGAGAFENCSKLKSIVIPKNVTKIGKKAFYGCKSLKTVSIKTSKLKSVGSSTFKKIGKKAKITVPKKKLKAYKKLLKKKVDAKTTIK